MEWSRLNLLIKKEERRFLEMSNVLRSEFLKAEVQINKQSKKLTRTFLSEKNGINFNFFLKILILIEYNTKF